MEMNAGYWIGHRYIVITICFIGIIFNILNIRVWCRLLGTVKKAMHILFLWLAIVDLLTLFSYTAFVIYFLFVTKPVEAYGHSKHGIYLVLISYNLYVLFYTASKWMTISLSIFRAIRLFSPQHRGKWCTSKRANIAAICIVIGAIVIWGTPCYIYYDVREVHNSTNTTVKAYWLKKSDIAQNYTWYSELMLWIYGVLLEMLPIVLLTIFSVSFIIKLCQNGHGDRQGLLGAHDPQIRKFTILLSVLAIMYVAAGLTMGIYAFYSAIKKTVESQLFYFTQSAFINNFTDPMELLNCSVNFIFLLLMYGKYKDTFQALFPCRNDEIDDNGPAPDIGRRHDMQVTVNYVDSMF